MRKYLFGGIVLFGLLIIEALNYWSLLDSVLGKLSAQGPIGNVLARMLLSPILRLALILAGLAFVAWEFIENRKKTKTWFSDSRGFVPRELTERQKRILREKLKDFPQGGSLGIYCHPGVIDAPSFGEQFAKVFRDAGWFVNQMGPDPDVKYSVGLWLVRRPTTEKLDALVSIFEKAGIEVNTEVDATLCDTSLFVGEKEE